MDRLDIERREISAAHGNDEALKVIIKASFLYCADRCCDNQKEILAAIESLSFVGAEVAHDDEDSVLTIDGEDTRISGFNLAQYEAN